MIFVSHARKDKPVVDIFVEKVLQVGFGISPKYIFYSSHPDTGIPGGDYINGTIFKHINDAKLIIIFLSKHYFDSAYCLCEMGASRLLKGKKKFLFLFPDLKYGEVEGVFAEKMIKKLDQEGMDSLIDAINDGCKEIITSKPSAPKRRTDEFLSLMPDAIKSIQPPSKVAIKDFEKIKQERDKFALELNQIEEEITVQKAYIAKLESIKDAKKVAAIKPRKNKKVEEAYEELLSSVESQLSELTGDGKKAIFYFWRYEKEKASRRISKELLEIESDLDDLFFQYDGDGIELGEKSESIMDSLQKFNGFLEGDDLKSLCVQYGFKEKDWEDFRKQLPSEPLQDHSYWRTNLY